MAGMIQLADSLTSKQARAHTRAGDGISPWVGLKCKTSGGMRGASTFVFSLVHWRKSSIYIYI